VTHAHPLDGPDLPARVQHALDEHLDHQREVLAELGPPMGPLVDAIAELLAGGKRLRAAFLYWGWRACGGPDDEAVVRAASAMELFQAAALLHDDVMDNSDLRRGHPTAHRAFARVHQQQDWNGDPHRFGGAAAILAGDLCLNWTDEAFATSGLPAPGLARARAEFDRMRTQLMGGQYLDMLEGARGWGDLDYQERLDSCRTVIRYKSARYSVEHPLLIGARAGGASPEAQAALRCYGSHLGEAFQLRDDVLGVFGDPTETGKPAGDDLREGKHTVLVAHTLQHADDDGAALVAASLGDPDLDEAGVSACREVIVSSGALVMTEAMISENAGRARDMLPRARGLDGTAHDALRALVTICTERLT
jgi:geranylgeranyl diphosphate synthase, type I